MNKNKKFRKMIEKGKMANLLNSVLIDRSEKLCLQLAYTCGIGSLNC